MADINDPVYNMVVKAKVELIFMRPFYGQFSSGLEIVDASSWCKTTATDGRHFYYNREHVKSLTEDELIFVMAHQVLHCVLMHIGRRGGRDPKLWGSANDYIINYTLVNEKCGKMPLNGCFDLRLTDEMSSEEVYLFLEENQTTMDIPDPLDEQIEMMDPSDEDENGKSIKVTVSGEGGPPRLSKEDVDKISNEIKNSVIAAAMNAKKAGHNLPSCVQRIIDQLVNPIMDWRSLLDAFYRSSVKDNYTFTKMSRRTNVIRRLVGRPICLPGRDYAKTIKLHVAIDVSGSMEESMLRDMLSEVMGIAQTFPHFEISVWSFCTQIHNPREYRQNNVDEIKTYPLVHGGGTSFEVNWEYMKENGIMPDRLVVFTDGMPNNTWGDKNYCDTLFIIHSDPRHQYRAPWGTTAWYEKKKTA